MTGTSSVTAPPLPLPPHFGDARLDGLYWPTRELEMPPQPRGEPDDRMLEGLARYGQPIVVRLLIDADGTVIDARLLSAVAGDEIAAARVVTMLRQTAFTPGRRLGVDVPSFLDVEVTLDPLPEPLPMLTTPR